MSYKLLFPVIASCTICLLLIIGAFIGYQIYEYNLWGLNPGAIERHKAAIDDAWYQKNIDLMLKLEEKKFISCREDYHIDEVTNKLLDLVFFDKLEEGKKCLDYIERMKPYSKSHDISYTYLNMSKGLLLIKQGKFIEAAEYIETIETGEYLEKIAPYGYDTRLKYLIEVYMLMGEYQKILDLLRENEKSDLIDPQYILYMKVYFYLTCPHEKFRNIEEVEDYIKKNASYKRSNPELYILEAGLLALKKDYTGALNSIDLHKKNLLVCGPFYLEFIEKIKQCYHEKRPYFIEPVKRVD